MNQPKVKTDTEVRLEEIDTQIYKCIHILTGFHCGFNPPPDAEKLARIKAGTPKAYNALMEYYKLYEEENEILAAQVEEEYLTELDN